MAKAIILRSIMQGVWSDKIRKVCRKICGTLGTVKDGASFGKNTLESYRRQLSSLEVPESLHLKKQQAGLDTPLYK